LEQRFEDHYEIALQELLAKKQKGQLITSSRRPAPSNVYNLMDALKQSLKGAENAPTAKKAATKPRRKAD
jgi:DNA end-binding protein Ku